MLYTMTKAQAREKFQTEVDEISTWVMQQMNKHLSEQSHNIMEQFAAYFESYCKAITQMQQSGEKGAIKYINFSWLRTNILAKNYKLRVEAYDKDWYVDRVQCSGEYDASTIYVFLDEFEQKIDAARKKYIDALSIADVKQLLLVESMKYSMIVSTLMQVAVRSAVETPAFQKMLREEDFGIYIGEFQDVCTKIFGEINRDNEVEEVS